jgi:peptidoglycan/xylan/chitin deacetylase (PgdA/CDA1 family)
MPELSLTFDDGPDPEWTPRLLDALAETRTKATFFVWGEQAYAHLELVRALLDAGHSVQPHCWSHTSHWDLSRSEIEADIDRVIRFLGDLGAPRPCLWRPPWGQVRVGITTAIATRFGLELAGWTIESLDWTGASADEMTERVRAALTSTPGDHVVLMHDGVAEQHQASLRSGCSNTVELARALASAPPGACTILSHGLPDSLAYGPSRARRALAFARR